MTDALKLAEAAVDKLMEAHDLLIEREKVHVGVARWTGRNGVCKYNKRLDQKRFGERMSKLPSKTGHHAIVINERILEDGNRAGFIDTIQHELAHAVCYAEYTEYPSRQKHRDYKPRYSGHGAAWKEMARRLGAEASACHSRRDRSDEYRYYIMCPSCGKEYGKTKRSKTIKQPFKRQCGECGHHPLSSYEAGQEPPEESGVVKVESLDWNNRDEWYEAGMP
jgi:predicted SprT family Zn-dependent metalloprotease